MLTKVAPRFSMTGILYPKITIIQQDDESDGIVGNVCKDNLNSEMACSGDQWHVTEVKQRRPQLVLGWVTIREGRQLWTCVHSSGWTLICDRPSV